MIKAVIFDRDGVLIDSEYTNIEAASRALQTFGFQVTEEDKQHVVGQHPREYSQYFQSLYGIDIPEFREVQRQTYTRVFEETPIFPEAVALVRRLQDA